MIAPFAVLLGTIALAPLVIADWWSRHYAKVALGLAAVTLGYYCLGLHAFERVLGVAHEYISFIALIGSLFVVSGGIHLAVKGEATPRANVVFLLIGAIVANLVGTTGASMLLIRPWLRMNRYRITAHHVVFFIFIVSNVGGCLTPIGDPPLFLGYLKGIPFWWVAQNVWPMWLVGVGTLLAMFYVVDRRNYLRAPRQVRETLAEPPDRWRMQGGLNLLFLVIILGAVFLEHPVFLRESIMVAAALGSWFTTKRDVHTANHFTFHPIVEVAILFIGIFGTMIPALDWLEANAHELMAPGPTVYYWAAGTLSSVLDNAPTYLSFLSASLGSFVNPAHVQEIMAMMTSQAAGTAGAAPSPETANAWATLSHFWAAQTASGTVSREHVRVACLLSDPQSVKTLVAISVASVFFGANTYIGNGPNFMVKSIAAHQKVHTPTFLGYVLKYTIPFMLPTIGLIWWLFLRQ